MLHELHIENLAVIENATVRFGEHLNVFTGETGAGKSILIGGINAILGQRVSREIVREGADKAFISAEFTDLSKEVSDELSELGFDSADELIISREISSDGRSYARVNSRPASVSVLRELGDMLVNIHGQHDSQTLLDPSKHLGILDNYARFDELLSDYVHSFRKLQLAAKELSRMKSDKAQQSKREAYLSEIIEDIGSLKISDGEDEEIEKRFKLLENAVLLRESLSAAAEMISGSEIEDGAEALVRRSYDELSKKSDIMPELKTVSQRLAESSIELADISSELSKLSGSLDIDDSEYDALVRRRKELSRIKHIYGPTLSDVLSAYEKAVAEYGGISESDSAIAKLEAEKAELLAEVTKKAEELSSNREKAAKRFVAEVTGELSFLNMPNVKIEVNISKGKLTSSGMDSVEFLISANKGESPKPLAKIASGGELSRIMLALKTVLSDRDSIPTLIFDEIDSGVGGRAAQKIGIKLREISRKRQVICVTHLAQIAIMADDHMLIDKSVVGGRTVTDVAPLDFEHRKQEIARILGGENITETVLKDAEEQLLNAMKT